MRRSVTVITPENIEVTYQVAGFASRFMALVIDLLIRLLLVLGVGMVIRLAAGSTGRAGVSAASFLSAIGVVLTYLIFVAYAIFFEMIWGGRTPGKRLFGLRVIRDGGYGINLVASATRNILLFADLGLFPLGTIPLILFGMPGLICLFVSPTYKRIGDYAAGTLVIVESGTTPLGSGGFSSALSPHASAFLPQIRNLDRLTLEDYRIVRRFTARRGELEIMVQAALSERIARPLMQKLDIQSPISYQLQYADLLEAIERRYAEEHGIL